MKKMNNKYSHLNVRRIAGDIGKRVFQILLLLLLSHSAIGQQSQLTPIGSTLTDITNTDDANQNVSITGVFTGGIRFGATVYTSMYVSSNGYVTFGHGNSGYSPTGIPGYTLGPIIAAQYDDLHPGTAGDIYYSQNTDYVVVTYYAIAPYSTPTGVGSGYNTFQIVLRKATGYNGSSNLNFTIEIRYMDLQWARSGNNSEWPTAGWSTGTGLVYSVLPYSGTSNFLLNESATNVGAPGLFNWAVEGGVVQSPPTVTTTNNVTSITGSSGISGGNVSADGGAAVTERGLVYATSQTPTISNSKVTSGTGTGTFTATMTGLNPGTTYYVRSYATNLLGTGYGPQVSFTTSSVSPPTVTTTAISLITTNSATSGYTVTSTGGATVTAQGIVWNTSGSPTTASYTGTSSGSLTGLSNNTTYYVRAFATNSSGTSYGSQLSLLTFPTDPTSPAAAPSTICNGVGSQLSVSNAQGTVTWYTSSCGGTYAGVGNPLTVYPAANTTYYARNINTTGSSAGCVTVSVIVNQPASAPTGATASAAGTGSANLSWAGSTGLAPITYSWAVGTTSGVTYESSYTSRGTTTHPTLTATATGLSQSTTYYMVVKASNSCATSVYNSSSSFRTYSVLTYIAGTNGTISGTLSQTVANTTSGTAVTAVPNTGYNFVNWSDGSVVNPRTDANVTNSITVSANFAPNRLVFGTEPVNKIAGANIPLTVRVTDTYGNTMASSAAAVTIAINDNHSIGGAGSLTGTLTVNAVSGVAVFTDLWINKTGAGYTLKASADAPITTAPVSNTFNITPAPIDHFTVAGITDPVVAGLTTSPVITAYDQYLNIKTDYTGTIAFTSTDPQSVLPSDFTYTVGNNGVNTFTNGATLKTTGEHTVTVTGNSKTGNQSAITVTPAAINHFTLVANGTIVAGVPFTVTATAYDEYGNIKTNYSGSNNVAWTTTAIISANGTAPIMPANGNQTFTAGAATISGFTLFNSDQLPLPTISITDGPTASPGTTAPITVKNTILDNFKVIAGTSQTAGVPFSVTVSARDVYWNIAKDYVGNIRFKSSNDALVTFPAGLQPFTLTDLGIRTFSTININMIGTYWLRAADAIFAFKSGEQQNIVVGPGAFSPLASKSFVTVDYTSRIAGEYVLVTIIPHDALGNLLYDQNISVYLDGVASDFNGPILVNNGGDGSYTALVRVTSTTEVNRISVKLDDTGFDQTRTISVLPAPVDLVHSVIGSNPIEMTTDQSSLITVQLKDIFDNNRTTSDGTVILLASKGLLTGGVTDNTDGTYSAMLFGNYGSVGISSLTGSFAGEGASSSILGTFTSTTSVNITEGVPALATTTIEAAPETMSTDEPSTITVQLKDQFGNLIINDRSTVELSTTKGVLGTVSYTGAGIYTAVLSGNNSGTGIAAITGTLAGAVAGSVVDDATVTITEGLPSIVTSTITPDLSSITTDGSALITIQLKDQFGNLIINNRGTISLTSTIGLLSVVTYAGNGIYTAVISGDTRGTNGTGNSVITANLNSIDLTQSATVAITEGLPNLALSTITASPSSITTDQTSAITVQLKDQFGNNIIHSGGTVNLLTDRCVLTSVTDNTNGTYTAILSANTSGTGSVMITGSLSGSITGPFTDNEQVTITEGLPDLSKIEIISNPASITADETSAVTIQLKDQHGNNLTGSRGTITLSTSPIGNLSAVTDNADGSYSATFSLTAAGTGTATITGNFAGDGTASTVSGDVTDNATIEVTYGVATKLTVLTQPSATATAGLIFAQQPVVRIEDHVGNLVISDNSTTLSAAKATGSDVLKGTLTLTATSGLAAFTDLFYTKAESITLEFSSSPDLTSVNTTSILVGHAPINYFALNSPPDITAGGSRAVYNVIRYDEFNNPVTTGSQTVYLFSSSTGVNKKFYNAASAGSIISLLNIPNGVSSFNLWYYDEKTGDHTITASDSDPEDGSVGITDGTDQISVNPALLKDFLVYGVSNPHNLGSWATVTVEARDIYNNRKTDYTGTLTFSNTDIDAVNPDDYQFLLSEQGIHAFTDQLKFSNKGTWWLTAVDLNEPAKYGYQADIIVRKSVTITANDRLKVYGESLVSDPTQFTVSPASAEITGVTLTSTGAVSTAGVNTYSITPSLATGTVDFDPTFFNITYADGILTVNRRDLVFSSFTADNKTYDGTTSATGTGFSNDRISGDDLTFSYSSAFADKDAGTGKTVNYTDITISGGASSDNYNLVSATGSTTADITPMPVLVTAYSGLTKVYGSSDPSVFDYTYSPLLPDNDVITGLLGRTAGEDVGNHTFAIGSLTAGGNYSLSVSATPTFGITPASLRVTADDKSKCIDGSTFTGYTLSYSGFTNGDGEGALNLTSLTYGGTAISATDAGSYSIEPSGIISTNYTIGYFNGNLIIKPVPEPTIAGVSSVCEGTTGSVYTTENGMSVYSWTVSPGGTIASAGTPADNTITITWNTAGPQTVSVNYTNGNGCTASGATVFNVTVNSLTAGGTLTGGSSPIALGESTGAIDLSGHNGSVVKWQGRLESGSWTDIANTSASYTATPNVAGTWEYRAVINNGTCSPANSSSVSIIVTASDAGAVTGGITPLCSANSTGTMTLADYNGGIVRWEKRVDGGSWLDIGNAGNTTYSEIPSSAGTWEYRAVINNGSDLTSAPTVIEVVNSTVTKGSVAGGTTICSGSISGVLTLSGNTGTVARWQSSVSPFSTWTDIINTINTYISVPLTETTQFRAVVQNGICATDYSDATTVTVTPLTVAGTVSGGTTICSGNTSGLLTLTGNTGNVIKWQSSTAPFINWTDIVNASNTYTSDVLTQTTQFRALVQNGICSQISSLSTEVTVNPVANGGSLSGRSTPIELGQSTGTITLSGYSGTVARWQKRLGAGSWTDVSNTSATYSTTPNVAGTWEYRAQIQSGTCTDVNSSSLSIQVLPSNAGAVTGGSTPICLNGSTGIMTLDGYTGTIVKWQKRVNQGSWSDIVNITATYTEIPSSEGTWEYRAIVNNVTDLTSAPTEIRVSPASNGGTISGSASVCFGTNSTLLTLSGFDGTVLKWQSSEDNWLNSVDINVTTSTYTAVNLTSTTQFRALVSGICFPVNSGEAAISVDPLSVGGILAGTGTITYGNATGTLTLAGQTGIVQKWQRKLNTGTWEDILSASNTYTEIPSAFGSWYYRAVVKSGTCSESNSSEVIVTVDKKELIVTGAQITSKIYDGDNTAVITNATLSGIVGSDDVTLGNQTSGSFAQVTVGTGISVATSPMTIAGASVSNYTLIQPVLAGVITAKPIAVMADAKTKVYGETDPSLTYTFAPVLVTGDSFVGSLTRVTGENVGTYAINQGSVALGTNYSLTYTAADLTVTSKPVTVTADARTKVYGETDPSLTYTFAPVLVTGDSFVGSLTRVTGENVGTYAINQGSVALGTNYSLIYTAADLTVTSKPVTVTADASTKVYGETDPSLTYTFDPVLVTGDSFVGSLTRVTGENVGTYAINQGNLALSTNYTMTFIDSVMTVTKATLDVTADNKVKTYGDANPLLSVSYSGFKGTDNITVIDVPPATTTPAVQFSIPGTFSIVASGATDNNYLFNYIDGTLVINKASLTFSADNITRDYLAANPELTFKISGLLNAEPQSVLDALPSIQTAAVQNSNAGTYQITVTGGSDNCYSFTYQAGTMTVSKISQTITFTDVPVSMLVKDIYTVSAASTSGITVLFESVYTEFASVNGNQLTGVSRGIASIRAYNPGDQNYYGAEVFAEVEIISTHKNILHLFTPNNDGYNDTWEIPDMAEYGNCDVRVFNRWGKQVYANKKYDNLWNGISEGVPLPEGAYYFIIKTENSGTINGTLNLVR